MLHAERLKVIADRQPRLAGADYHYLDRFGRSARSHFPDPSTTLGHRLSAPLLRLRSMGPANIRQVARIYPTAPPRRTTRAVSSTRDTMSSLVKMLDT